MNIDVDPSNYMIALVGYVIVFSALLMLYLVFNNVPKVLILITKLNALRTRPDKKCEKCGEFLPGIENAAIAATIYMYFNELHDEENTIITIKKVKKDYSPWSSKIYGVSNFQR